MAELTIYDSQGAPIENETGPSNDRIQDFFFDGVRFAIDRNRKEIVIFFRARDNKTSRSEQYYALFQYSTRSEIGTIVSAVEDRIENKYNKFLDTSNEDTKFFELLSSNSSGVMPGDSSTLQDIKNLLADYKQVTLGVGKYSEAYELFSELWKNDGCNKIAVSENANGQSVSSHDLVIEKGNHNGLELIGDTKDEIEALREQRRIDITGAEPASEDSNSTKNLIFIGCLSGIGIIFLTLILAYSGCLIFDMAAPGTGLLPYTDNCTPIDSELNGITAETTDTNELRIDGSISGETPQKNISAQITVNGTNGSVYSKKRTTRVSENGTFKFRIPFGQFSSSESGEYSAKVKYDSDSKSANFTIGDSSTPSSDVQTPTPTPTETTTPDPTPTPTPTPTETATTTPDPTPTPTPTPTETTTTTPDTSD